MKIAMLALMSLSVIGMEQESLCRACQSEDAWDRLLIGANRYCLAKDPGYAKWRKKLEAKIQQKMEDGKLSESAAGEIYATDYLSDMRLVLVKGPGPDAQGKEIDRSIVLDVARHIRYALEKRIVVNNWRLYEREVVTWGNWFLAQTETH